MLTKLAKKMTQHYIKNGSISEDEKEKYDYCFEVFLATIVNLVAIILIACISATYLSSLIFIIIFLIMRALSGGYHADTHFRCFLILIFIHIALVIMLEYITKFLIISIVFDAISFILFLLIAPVDNKNNVFPKEYRKKFKIKLMIANIVFVVASAVLMIWQVTSRYAFVIAYTNFIVSVSCLFALVKEKIAERRAKNL